LISDDISWSGLERWVCIPCTSLKDSPICLLVAFYAVSAPTAPLFEEEVNLRQKITKNAYDLSAIIVLEEPIKGKYELKIDAKVYEDVKEELIILS